MYVNHISGETIFVTAEHKATNGIVGVNKKGQVLSVNLDEQTIIPYILTVLNNTELAFKLAGRANFPRADDLHVQQYNQIFQSGQFREAAKIAANSLRVYYLHASILRPCTTWWSLAHIAILRDVTQLFEKWLKDNKLTCSEELGDIVRLNDMTLEGKRPQPSTSCERIQRKVTQLVNGESGPLVDVEGVSPLRPGSLHSAAASAEPVTWVDLGSTFADMCRNDARNAVVVDVFMSQNMIQPAKSFLLDALKDNKPEWGPLQTRLLEMNLLRTPQVADAILENEMFTHYDRPRIANLCEKAGLLQRALEHYEDLADIKRAIVPTAALQPEGVIQIVTKYSDILQPVKLIEMFESFKSFEGLYYYLGSVVNAATRTSQIPEVERICRESNHYNPEKVKNFLKEAKLADQLLLIILCDRFDFIHNLVLYLDQNGLTKFIEIYVQRVSSVHTPQVIGGLLDVDCDKGTIKSLLTSVTGNFPIDELVHEVEQRNRLKLVLPNNNPEVFLKDNNVCIFFDIVVRPIVVGKFCEKRDPYLAYTAYAKGFCNDELIAITNESSMFKQQARYLVKRCQPDLWAQFLARAIFIIVATALSECTDPDDVSITVKAFIQADLLIELIELLEKIIIEPSVLKAAEKAHMWPLYIKYDE
ncbi:armadillo-type protein [Mycena galopus ATCC 62051]|nr:armadillo-type protein [Mycena galopus ATCC 62051]